MTTGRDFPTGRRQPRHAELRQSGAHDVIAKRVGIRRREVVRDALTNLARRPLRTLACALGTVVAAAALVTTDGLGSSAQQSVTSSFTALEATSIEFAGPPSSTTEAGVSRLKGIRGVKSAGLMWDLNDGQPVAVGATPQALLSQLSGESGGGAGGASLSFTAASTSALDTIGARVTDGRLYQPIANRRHEMVALLGEAAAAQLGINGVRGEPAIFVDGSALTVIGIIGSTNEDSQLLLGVTVPPYVASVLAAPASEHRVVVRTSVGAANMVGQEGPYALDPYAPSTIAAELPPSPSALRAHVERSLTALLRVMEFVGLGVGFLVIVTVTVISVGQRRSEIGLRRAIGYGRWDVARVILTESACIGGLGGLVGLSTGVFLTSVIAKSHGWIPVLDLRVALAAPALGLVVGMVGGIVPAALAMRITPLAALRSA